MKENRTSFVFYASFYEALQDLKDKERLQVYDAICDLALTGNERKMTGLAKTIFTLIKPQVLANTKKFANGKRGGRPKKETTGYEKQETTGYEDNKTTGYDEEETETKPNENENVNVNDNVNENVNAVAKAKSKAKHTYGEFENVKLTDEEHEKLKQLKVLPMIDKLSSYIASTGKKYKSHYATILNWHRKDSKPLPDWYHNQDIVQEEVEEIDAVALMEELRNL